MKNARWLNGPTEYSVLCDKHFTADCFEADSEIAAKMGLTKRKRLTPNAVPTVFERPRQPLPSENASAGLGSSSSSVPLRSAKRACVDTTCGKTGVGACGSQSKRTRQAYEKRERSRIRKRSAWMYLHLDFIFLHCFCVTFEPLGMKCWYMLSSHRVFSRVTESLPTLLH